MSADIRIVYSMLSHMGFSPEANVATIYNLPKEFTSGIEDINYEKGQIISKIPIGLVTDEIPLKLDQADNVLIYVGKGAIGLTPGSKTYHMLDIPSDERVKLREAMSEIGYETEDTELEKAMKKG